MNKVAYQPTGLFDNSSFAVAKQKSQALESVSFATQKPPLAASDKKNQPRDNGNVIKLMKRVAAVLGVVAGIFYGIPALKKSICQNILTENLPKGKSFKPTFKRGLAKTSDFIVEKRNKALNGLNKHVLAPVKNFMRNNVFNYLDDK